MRHSTLLAAASLSLALSPACQFGDHVLSHHRTQVETRAITAGGTFQIRNTNGSVEVETGAAGQVRIEADEAAGSEAALNEVEVLIAAQADRVDVSTRQPQGHWFGRSARVHYHITVPENVNVEAKTTNGSVRVSGISGAVQARSVNGAVRVEGVAGQVVAETTNGSVHASYRAVPAEGSHRFATTNGSVTLRLPADARGTFRADTVNGSMSTDFPLDVHGSFMAKHLTGALGQGGGHFELKAVNGSVGIKKR
jgi:hypothetical protein